MGTPDYLLILTAPFVAVGWTLTPIPGYISRKYFNGHRIKPFDCAMCMGFWLGLAACLYNYYLKNGFAYNTTDILFSISIPFVSMVAAAYIDKKVNPFWK